MDFRLLKEIEQLNPWLRDRSQSIAMQPSFIPRIQIQQLLNPEWDSLWTILEGPRRAGKTTLGNYLAKTLIVAQRYSELLYLNCDYLSIREWLSSPIFITEAIDVLSLQAPIVFIDEVQRLPNPGLLLKAVIDLGLPIKHIATGSSQLEIKSKVQEFLTGRQLTSLILPLSYQEWGGERPIQELLTYGSYPQVLLSENKIIQLTEIYTRYIQKDIIEILKMNQPDVLQNLLTLLAHSSGQLVNYNQLATDCKANIGIIRNQLNILEKTFVVSKVLPFVGNKRVEVTSNPKYYFIDNGFRNVALRNFENPENRTDLGLLVEGFIFQEIFKFRAQHYLNFDIHFWRTKSGAEVDFVVFKNDHQFIPIEIKYQRFTRPSISRGFRSFLEAYRPQRAVIVTRDYIHRITISDSEISFIPITQLNKIFQIIKTVVEP
ncbi:MAG: ATPase [Coxiella sp. RIFCSPHIGHO2_12_FULL_44_14]|nr:MAG: ATPase [Coxiella sp. RIFCSPHIGHO2_12_FULL_44_14]